MVAARFDFWSGNPGPSEDWHIVTGIRPPTQLEKLYSDTCVWGLFPGASPAVGRRQKSYKKTTHIDDREEQRFVDQLERKEEKKRKIEK